MTGHPLRLAARTGLAALLGSTLAAAAASQDPGDVLDEQKLSDLFGGFAGTLDNNDEFGHAVANLGDLDGNGRNDLAVGSHTDDDGGPNRGAVWILFMKGDGTVLASQKISDTAGGFGGALDDSDEFGHGLAAVGDLDGDGRTELAVGVKDDDDGGNDRGAVWILFLNADGTVKAEQKISHLAGGLPPVLGDDDEFGRAIAALDDLDGDGLGDIAVGARNDDDGGTNRGAVYVLALNADGTVKSTAKLSSTAGSLGAGLDNNDEFGFAVAALGDVDGDGVTDLGVGARGDDDGGRDRGAVWVVFLNADGTAKGKAKISSTEGGFGGTIVDGDFFGSAVGALGDLDGDKVPDLLVGVPDADAGGGSRGRVWMVRLAKTGAVKGQLEISSEASDFVGPIDDGDRFGSGVASLGDLDGDSVIQVAVGAPRDDDGGGNRGAAWILFVQGPAQATAFTPPGISQFDGRPGRSILLPPPPSDGADEAIATPVVVVPRRSGQHVSVQVGGPAGETQSAENETVVFVEGGSDQAGSGPSHAATGGFFGHASDGEAPAPYLTDLVVTNEFDDSFSLLKVNAAGDGYDPQVVFSLLPQNHAPVVVRSGDFDEDGNDDVVIGGRDGVSLFVSDGVGGFVPSDFEPTSLPVTDLDVGLVDADGHLDVVAASGREITTGSETEEGYCTVLRGDGDGGLLNVGRFAENGRAVASVLLGEFNGDLLTDALIASHQYAGGPGGEPQGLLELYVGDAGADGAGAGLLPSPLFTPFATPNLDRLHPTFGAARDFDGDTLLDAIFTGSDNIAHPPGDLADDQPPVRLTVLRNLGGDFEVTQIQTAYVGRGVDPLVDDIIADPGEFLDSIVVFFTDNNAGQGEAGALEQGFSSYITVFKGDGSAGFFDPSPNQVQTGNGPGTGALADMDGPGGGDGGDGEAPAVGVDVIIPNMLDNSVTIHLGDGQGGIAGSHTIPAVDDTNPASLPPGYVGGPREVRVARIDGDDNPDIAVLNMWTLDGEGGADGTAPVFMNVVLIDSFVTKEDSVRPPRGGEIALGDVTGDDVTDLLVTQRLGPGGPDVVLVYPGTGGVALVEPPLAIPIPAGMGLSGGLEVADLDGNGDLDVVTTALGPASDGGDGVAATGKLLVWHNTAGVLTPSVVEMGAAWVEVLSLGVGDVTGDGRQDVAAGDRAGRLHVARGTAGGGLVKQVVNPGAAATGGGALVVGELDGNGLADVFSSTGNAEGDVDQAFVRTLVSSGAGVFQVRTIGGLTSLGPFGPMRPMLGDLNDDGADDLVLVHGLVNSFSILLNQLSRFEAYGTGKPGAGDVTPTLAGRGHTTPGGALQIEARDGLGGAGSILIVGFGRDLDGPLAVETLALFIPLPLDGDAGVPGAGGFDLPASLPPNPAVVGVEVDMQLAVIDPAAGGPEPFGVALSNGLAMTIVQ